MYTGIDLIISGAFAATTVGLEYVSLLTVAPVAATFSAGSLSIEKKRCYSFILFDGCKILNTYSQLFSE